MKMMKHQPKPRQSLMFFLKAFQPFLGRFAPRWYLSIVYRLTHHRALNFKKPQLFTEKLQFLKLFVYPRDPLVIRASDRVSLREMLKDKKLSAYLIPGFGPFTKVSDIPWKKLPKQFVIKATHGPGMQLVILDKRKMDMEKVQQTIQHWFKLNYGRQHLEKQYAPIAKQIIIETYLGVETSPPLEYQCHMFHGQIKYLSVQSGQGLNKRYSYFLPNWTPFPGGQLQGFQTSDYSIVEPPNFQGMIQLAEKLAAPFPYVRVDLYNLQGKIYCLGLTFLPYHGNFVFADPKSDILLGTWLSMTDDRSEPDMGNKPYQ
jgi:hypothetical protein